MVALSPLLLQKNFKMSSSEKISILLVDDSVADNYLHTRIIRNSGVANVISVVHNGIEALEFLTTQENGAFPRPDLIILDINMPGMNGWEFLDNYHQLKEEIKGGAIICMLTSSTLDREKIKEYNIVDGYIVKPLDNAKFLTILEQVRN